MTYVPVYDVANDGVGLYFPLLGLGLILVGAVMKWVFGKAGLHCYPLMAIGVFTILAAGALPWWDYRRVTQAVANGEAKRVDGPIRDWRIARVRGMRTGVTSNFSYTYYELFSVGAVDFDIEWGSLEAGFTNRGSTKGNPAIHLADGMAARIRYLPIDGPGKPPRIVRLELASGDRGTAAANEPVNAAISGAPGRENETMVRAGGTARQSLQSRVTDDAGILSAAQKAQLDVRLAAFEQMTGHQFVVVTISSLGGEDIAHYAATLANDRGIGRQAWDDGILLLVVPGERQARITVGRGLETRLPDAASKEIMEMAILPLFRRGDIPGGIDAGASMIIGKMVSGDRR